MAIINNMILSGGGALKYIKTIQLSRTTTGELSWTSDDNYALAFAVCSGANGNAAARASISISNGGKYALIDDKSAKYDGGNGAINLKTIENLPKGAVLTSECQYGNVFYIVLYK